MTDFNPHDVLLSKGEREAGALLAHAKYAYRFMIDWMKLRGPMVSMSQAKMVMTNESSMTSMPSASDPARGTTAFTVVVDEIGFLPNSDDAWASIEPVADVGALTRKVEALTDRLNELDPV